MTSAAEVLPGGVSVQGWEITAHTSHMSPSAQIDKFFEDTGIKCPEMVFLDNQLKLHHKVLQCSRL